MPRFRLHAPSTAREKFDSHLDWAFLVLVWLAVVPALILGGAAPAGSRVHGLTHLGIAAATVLWALRLLINPRRLLLWSPATWAGLVVLAGLAGHWFLHGGPNAPGRDGYAGLLAGTLLFLVVINNLHRQLDRPVITLSLLATGTLVAMSGIFEWLRGAPVRPFGGAIPADAAGVSGVMATPGQFAGLLALLAPMAFVIALGGRLNGASRVCLFFAGGLMLVGIAFSLSPAAWIVSAALGLVLIATVSRQYSYRRAAGILAVAVAGVATAFIAGSYQFRFRVEEMLRQVFDRDRYLVWQGALDMWKDAPVGGSGPGSLAARLAARQPPVNLPSTTLPRNDLLESLGDYGVVLTLLLGGLMIVTTVDGWRAWRMVKGGTGDLGGKRSNRGAFLLGGIIGGVTMAGLSLLDAPFSLPANALAFWALIGLIAGHSRFATRNEWLELNWLTRLLTVALLLAGAGGLVWLHR